jgi:hypothetical protein
MINHRGRRILSATGQNRAIPRDRSLFTITATGERIATAAAAIALIELVLVAGVVYQV